MAGGTFVDVFVGFQRKAYCLTIGCVNEQSTIANNNNSDDEQEEPQQCISLAESKKPDGKFRIQRWWQFSFRIRTRFIIVLITVVYLFDSYIYTHSLCTHTNAYLSRLTHRRIKRERELTPLFGGRISSVFSSARPCCVSSLVCNATTSWFFDGHIRSTNKTALFVCC